MCHGQMITLPGRQPNEITCDVCKRTVPRGERVAVVKAKCQGEVRKLVVCRDHNHTEEKLRWKQRGFTR